MRVQVALGPTPEGVWRQEVPRELDQPRQDPRPFRGASDEAAGKPRKAFDFEWSAAGAPPTANTTSSCANLRQAEKLARQAAEQAQDYAQQAANKVRETDWEGVGREVRSALSRAMSELEDAFSRVRSGWDAARGGSAQERLGRAQRVRIEQDDAQPRRRRIARRSASRS
jgi:hypothetical protein